MNLALFLTKDNLATLRPIVEEMAQKQQETVNGACIVVHDSHLTTEEIAFTIPLARRFKASASTGAQIPETSPLSALFSQFLTVAYTRYPGPWLVFDEPAVPKCGNFMQELLKQHGKYGGKMTGRASIQPGSATPIGPVTLELDFKALKFLRYPTRQNWRERGQFLFARAGFQLVPAEEWLFGMKRVEVTQPEIRAIFHKGGRKDPSEVGLGDSNPNWRSPMPEDMDALSNSELVDIIVAAGQPKPHHFTGRDKLLSMARELSLSPA